ncbi:Der GTPase-activating protein YihI [Shewanella sp. 1_MG-2023]|uniref:Der GTPase-activating protein YihI n=1 Tax=unclassified Shewanella TaxID=196818 RepID=UPI0026E26BD5|nr:MULTISPECIES: Der GTPase-activating protein YihI [unclassified Shewanella]MDO6611957.1 Der GTPase-activating protein YihI [Shewanella sp. 7_MG-2023]MDO6771967.1 Der GTPase-activating protein YihI [Shewanella sp. 2_MG-2023]MDO6794311.1 Der GTPase-activating protein YihI [Shewanella sp. 1_MG-2023]
MARSKKSRKGGENGPTQAPRVKKADRKVTGSRKKDNGHKSGSRHNEALIEQQSPHVTTSKSNDPRHGSKKPVPLMVKAVETTAPVAKVKQPKLTDEQKLLKIEDDPRFNNLLDLLEEGKDLSADDQKWLDSQLAKMEALMEKLGISDAEELPAQTANTSKKPASDDDLYERFESGADVLKDYQS